MRMTKEAMAKHHRTIVESAAKLFRETGIDRTSVSEAMKAAKLTHGGFYRHFTSKEALVTEVVSKAFDGIIDFLTLQKKQRGIVEGVAAFTEGYLSEAHLNDPGHGCPIPTIGIDLARNYQEARKPFQEGVERLVTAISEGKQGDTLDRRAAALRHIAILVGAIVIARAVDEELGTEILAACREALLKKSDY